MFQDAQLTERSRPVVQTRKHYPFPGPGNLIYSSYDLYVLQFLCLYFNYLQEFHYVHNGP